MSSAPPSTSPVVPTIAVVVPCHNRAHAIADTLQSLLRQEGGLQDVGAVYLADDCSSDDTVAVAERLWRGAAVPLQVVPAPRNLGTYGNTNHALERLAASYEWLLILHDDDEARPDWVQLMTARIRDCAPSVATICSSYDVLHSDGRVEPGEDDAARPVVVVAGGAENVRSTLHRGCWWHISGCAIRTRAFQAVGQFDPELPQCSDWDWILRCLRDDWDVEYIPRTLIGYRQHAASVSSRSFQVHRDLRENLQLIERYLDFLSTADVLRLHARLAGFAARRGARAALNGYLPAVWSALRVSQSILASAGRLGPKTVRRRATAEA